MKTRIRLLLADCGKARSDRLYGEY